VSVWESELERYGFEEPERGRVEDTPENRRHVRMMGASWAFEVEVDEEMRPTGLLRVFTAEQVTARREDVWDRRKNLLVDPENPWSDYLSPADFPLEPDAPHWVLTRAQYWKKLARDGVPESEREPLPLRCETIRDDETRCWNWATHPVRLPRCRYHAGWESTDGAARIYARQRILELSPDVVNQLEFLAYNGDTDTVKLRATTEILDRAGIRGGSELDVRTEVEVHVTAEQVTAKLDQLKERTVKRQELESRATVAGEVVPNESGPGDGGA
jgi:hypothetical protein